MAGIRIDYLVLAEKFAKVSLMLPVQRYDFEFQRFSLKSFEWRQ